MGEKNCKVSYRQKQRRKYPLKERGVGSLDGQ